MASKTATVVARVEPNVKEEAEEQIQLLNKNPARVKLTIEEPWHSQGIHQMSVKNFYVYFWINEESETVQITGIVYQKRDQKKQLKQMDIE